MSKDTGIYSLREELIETQKTRTALIKWKLILVSVLGATGLGFMESNSQINAELLLCLVPLVCAYVDMQYENLSFRIMAIATFLREVWTPPANTSEMQDYEKFVEITRKKIRNRYPILGRHSLQGWLMRGSSILFYILLILYAGISLVSSRPKIRMWSILPLLIAGGSGVAFTLWMFHHSQRRRKILKNTGKDLAEKRHGIKSTKSGAAPDDVEASDGR